MSHSGSNASRNTFGKTSDQLVQSDSISSPPVDHTYEEDTSDLEFDDTSTVAEGKGRSRFIILAIALICSIWSTGLIFGWAPLYGLLIRDGVYSELCNTQPSVQSPSSQGNNSALALPPSSVDGACDAQQTKLNLIYTAGSACAQASLFVSGILLDWQGPKITATIAASLVALGCAIFGISASGVVDLYIFGFALMGFGGAGVNLATYTVSNLFPHHKSWVVSALVGVWTLSSLWFLLLRPPFDAGIPLAYSFYFQAALVFATAILFFFTFPSRSLLEGEYFTFTQWLPWNTHKTSKRQRLKNEVTPRGEIPMRTFATNAPELSTSTTDETSSSNQAQSIGTSSPSSLTQNQNKEEAKDRQVKLVSPQPLRSVSVQLHALNTNPFHQPFGVGSDGLILMDEEDVMMRVKNNTMQHAGSSSSTDSISSACPSSDTISSSSRSSHHSDPDQFVGDAEKNLTPMEPVNLGTPNSITKCSKKVVPNVPIPISRKNSSSAEISHEAKRGRQQIANSTTALSPFSLSTWKIILRDALSADFILLIIWFSVSVLFFEFYIGTIADSLEYRMAGKSFASPSSQLDASPATKAHISKEVDTYVLVFNLIYAVGFIFVPMYAWATDNIGFTGSFFLATLFGVLYPFLSMIPWIPAQFFTYIVYSAGIQFLYSCQYGYVASRFGYERFGILIGVMGIFAAALIPLQSVLLTIVLKYFNGNFFWMYMIQGFVCLPLFAVVVVTWWKTHDPQDTSTSTP